MAKASGARLSSVLLGTLLSLSEAASGLEALALDTPAAAPLVPVLPELEWLASGVVAVDLLADDRPTAETRPSDVRRARIGGALLWKRTWAASVGGDLAGSGTLGHASVAYVGGPWHIEVGRFPEPFGLIQQQASAGQALMELPTPVALSPTYGLGVAAGRAEARYSLTLGAFVPTPAGDRIQRHRAEQAVTVRLTAVPWHSSSALVHVGVAFSRREVRDDVLQFATVPETVLLKDYQIASAPLAAPHYGLWGLEFGILGGPVLLQAEGTFARFPLVAGVQPTHAGGYAQVAWTLGADSRGYRPNRGVFGPVHSKRPVGEGGFGALELAARYSHLDLTSTRLGDQIAAQGRPDLRDSYSGELGTVRSLGVNWHATDLVKFSIEALHVERESRTDLRRTTVYQGRIQVQLLQP